MNAGDPENRLEIDWFDGRSARARAARAWVTDSMLVLQTDDDGSLHQYRLESVAWPDTDLRGARILTLPDGSSAHCKAPGGWEDLARQSGRQTALLGRLRGSMLAGIVAVSLVFAVGLLAWRFAVPWVVDIGIGAVPAQVERQIGEAALASVDNDWLRPSKLPASHQARLREAFFEMRADSGLPIVPTTLLFRASTVGPNAFALPGGFIVMTDELVELARDDEAMVLGVLAHEYGHVVERHGMRLLMQSLLVTAILGLATGDVGGLIGGAPLLMSQLAYSRDNEHRADTVSIQMLKNSGRSPLAMARLLERLESVAGSGDMGALGVLFSSHPATAERVARFEAAVAR